VKASRCPFCGSTDICETVENTDGKDCECLDCNGRWRNDGR